LLELTARLDALDSCAEAVLADIQVAHEWLHAQKTLVDQAVTQATALEFQTKQAETVIAALRQERGIVQFNGIGAVGCISRRPDFQPSTLLDAGLTRQRDRRPGILRGLRCAPRSFSPLPYC